jgi:hypothetical protein
VHFYTIENDWHRAFDFVAALQNPEIMTYLKPSDRDFRTQLVAKVFTSVQCFAPFDVWTFDTASNP